jgi:broad specificity phosphatase PhoE
LPRFGRWNCGGEDWKAQRPRNKRRGRYETVHSACYQLVPEAGEQLLTDKEREKQSANCLMEEIKARVAAAPIVFALCAQVAERSDRINDPSIAWPDNRKWVLLGRLEIRSLTANTAEEDRRLVFNPSNVPTGIETADMLSSFYSKAFRLSAEDARDVAPVARNWATNEKPGRLKINEIVTWLVVPEAVFWMVATKEASERVNEVLPIVYVARHGETAWTLSGQYTGLTDLPLTERGERNARRLAERLRGLTFAKVFTSPLQRAARTCELAGFGAVAEVDRELVEWDYGQYDGRRTAEIRKERPDWELFRDGCPGGESPAEVAARADRVVSRVRAVPGDVLLFSSGHLIRVLATRWIGLEVTANAKRFMLSTASLSAVGYENELSRPVIRVWNDTHHVGD